jgi:cellulose synthase/poly-beta-1,6-N-acetylglucosamine synthase-like glycosyltransferase
MHTLVVAVLVLSLGYTLVVALLSRRHRDPTGGAPGVRVVLLVPCLNEETVIDATIERIRHLDGDVVALIIDDGSVDATAEKVRAAIPSMGGRLSLFQRTPPDARRGKGAALNAALAHLAGSPLAEGHSADDIIVGVLDADGRLDPAALKDVVPFFADPAVGAVQTGVRMYNAHANMISRLQDVEFVIYTEIFQKGRQALGSSGLGGNGQFARLSALQSLGPEPWTDCLTEDLDLGIRLLVTGWKNRFCGTTAVSQQAVVQVRRWLRQRTRWFQGNLQCLGRIPAILTSPKLTMRAAVDLVIQLLNPALTLLTSLLPALAIGGLVASAVTHPAWLIESITASHGLFLLAAYVLAMGMAPIYAVIYRRATPTVSPLRCLLIGHVYCFYGWLWYVAGWRAFVRHVRGQGSWAKTERVVEAPAVDDAVVETPPTAETITV